MLLRGIWLPITLASALAAMPLWLYRDWRREQRAILELGKTAATIQSRPIAPRLAALFPTKARFMFDRVVSVAISTPSGPMLCDPIGPVVTDADLVAIGAFRHAEAVLLNTNRTQITDKGVFHLKHLSSLRELDLSGAAITDAGAEVLGRFGQLRSLNLQFTRITDRALERIAALDQLEHLNINFTPIAGPGIVHLTSLPKLSKLEAGEGLSGEVGGKRRTPFNANLHRLLDVNPALKVDPPPSPRSPSGLSATVQNGEVRLQWKDNSDNESCFLLEGSTTGEGWSWLGTVDPNVCTFSTAYWNSGTTCTVRVLAVNYRGYSDPIQVRFQRNGSEMRLVETIEIMDNR